MNNTVQKLMELADEYADRAVLMAGVSDASNDVRYYRQALQDELTRLFTPLSEPDLRRIRKAKHGHDEFARAIESAHGITGESK